MTVLYPPRMAPARADPPPALITRIVLPLDGTPRAERVLPSAVVLARRLQAEVMLVRAYGGAPALPSGNARYNATRRAPGEPLHVASLYLARVEREMRGRGVRTYSWLLQWGAEDSILDVAMQGPADLILLATGLGGPGRHAPAESVAAHLVLRAVTPMLLLGPKSKSPFERPTSSGVRVLAIREEGRPDGRVRPYAELFAEAFAGCAIALRTPRLRMEPGDEGRGEPSLAAAVRRATGGTVGRDDRGAGEIDAGEVSLDQVARAARASADLLALGRPEPPDEREAFVARLGGLLRASGVPLLVIP